jgi:hypothetical protein
MILSTTNGGTTWSSQSSGTINVLWNVTHIDANNVTASGSDGTIIKTTDSGTTWTQQSSGTSNYLQGISFTDINNGVAVGVQGTILRTTNGGVTFVEEEDIDGVPTDFLLLQNFPNPFNPSTNIKYSIPEASFVQLKVYDVLGNEVAILINEAQSMGNYKTDFTGINITSGIYFYTLRAGSFVQTKKMLLLK